MTNNQIGIFQHLPTQGRVKSKKKNANYWFEKLHSQEQKMSEEVHNLMNKSENVKIEENKTPETKGKEQHAKEQALKLVKDKQKVDELVKKTNRTIINASSIFPWSMFPNTIDVEESRVTFMFSQFMTSQSHSVDIKDISNVSIESGFFFATLQVVSRTFVKNNVKIHHLNKKQAVKVKEVIEGLRTFSNNNIDTSDYKVDDLVNKLCELNSAK